MTALAPADIVAVWETGESRPDWNKALVALARATPGSTPGDLATLSIGERNARLLELREATIGPVMRALVNCSSCGEPLEFEQRIDELLAGYAPPPQREFHVEIDGYQLHYRLMTSQDLATAVQGDPSRVRRTLAERTVIGATRDGETVPRADLPEPVLEALGSAIGENDALAQLAIPLACAACGHVWNASLEVVPFLWAEIERRARTILEDVVTLAHAYGWSEAAILEMSQARRQYYLDAIE